MPVQSLKIVLANFECSLAKCLEIILVDSYDAQTLLYFLYSLIFPEYFF